LPAEATRDFLRAGGHEQTYARFIACRNSLARRIFPGTAQRKEGGLMFVHLVASLTISSTLITQAPLPSPEAAPPAAQIAATTATHNTPVPGAQAITVPAGTSIPLTLMSAVKSKSTMPGDTVRAVVAFPVTVGSQLAIPAGTYVEGVVSSVTARPMSSQQPSLRVNFDRLLFSNGYSVALQGENTQALVMQPGGSAQPIEVAELTPLQFTARRFAMGEGQQTQLPPLPQLGPSPAVVGGVIAGGFAAFIVGMVVFMHHRANGIDYVVFDAGWQFQMVLDSPLTLDAAQVSAAAATPSAN
jgi:hypothetical protein